MPRSRLEGTAELKRALVRAGALAIPALAASAVEEQEKVMADAKVDTPVDTGTARASGTVYPPEISATEVKVVAGFGGAAEDYIIPLHERLDVSHVTGSAKFLEKAFLLRAREMPRNLALGVYAALRRL